jgi:exodeoxyribonuclease VII large subunit
MAQQHRNSSLTTRLLRALELHVQLQNANLVTLKSRFHAAEHYQAQDRRARFNSLTLRLQALSPLAVLERGYSLAYDEQGRIVTRAGTLSEGSLLTTRFAEGSAVSRITKIENTGPHKPRKKEKKPA